MGHHHPVTVDPQEQHRSEAIWHNFINVAKWSSVGIAIILILMAFAFIR